MLEEGIWPAAYLCHGGRWEEAAGVNGDAKNVEELQPCLLLGEEGYAVIVKFLTAKVMQGLRSIRLPVIIYREGKKKKTKTPNVVQIRWHGENMQRALGKGFGFLKTRVIHTERWRCCAALPWAPSPGSGAKEGAFGPTGQNQELQGHQLLVQHLRTRKSCWRGLGVSAPDLHLLGSWGGPVSLQPCCRSPELAGSSLQPLCRQLLVA